MAFSRIRYEAQKEREKKQEKQLGNQGNKGRVETPAPTQKTTPSRIHYEAQKEREKQTRNVREEVDLRRYLPATPAPTRNVAAELEELVASTASRREELTARLEAARQKEVEASHAQLLAANEAMRTNDPTKARGYADAVKAASDEYNAIKRELEQLDYLEKYKDETYDDTFGGQFGANRTLGRLGQDTSAAYNEFFENPTDENRAYAEALDLLTEHFKIQNKTALDGEGAKATWITKDAAQYLPQWWDQTKATVAGGAAGALTGAGVGSLIGGVGAIPGAIKGAQVGATAASGMYSYEQMRGAAFHELLSAGMDEETARAAASDEAVISAFIEMGDTALTVFSFGTGKLLTSLGKNGAKAVAGEAVESGVKKLLKALGKYGVLNIGQEMLEEGTQQAVSLANQSRWSEAVRPAIANVFNGGEYDPSLIKQPETGVLDLLERTRNTAQKAFSGEDANARFEILEAAKAGGRIAAMFGGVQRVGDLALETGIRSHIGKKYSDAESVQALIDSGLESAEGTESRKLAEKLQAKKQAGKTISNAEVGALQQANVAAMEAEQNVQPTEATEEPQETLERLARETVEEQQKTPESAQNEASDPFKEFLNLKKYMDGDSDAESGDNQRTSVPYNAMATDNPVRQNVIQAKRDLKKWTGYGDAGQKTFEQILENGNQTPEEVRNQFQTSYELGRLGTPRKSVNLANDLQEHAFTAGYQDYLVDQDKDKNKKFSVSKEAGFDRTGAPADVTDTQAEILDMLAKNMGSKSYFDGDQDFNAEIQGDGTVRYSTTFNREIRDDNGNVVKTLTAVDHALHELGAHRAMQVAPESTRAFVNKFYAYKMEGMPSTVGTLAEQKQEQYGRQKVALTTDKAFEEVIANEIFPTLYRSNEQELVAGLKRAFGGNTEEVRQSARTFRDVLNDMWRKIKEFAAKLRKKGDIAGAKEAEQAAATVRELRDMFEAILKEVSDKVKAAEANGETATKNTAQVSGEVQNNLKGKSFQEDKYFARQMDKWAELTDGTRVKVGVVQTGSALNRVGLPASGMYFDVGKIKKSMGKHSDHLTPSVLKGIPDLLNDPVVITQYTGPNGDIKNTVSVYGNLFVDGKPVVVGIVMNRDSSGRNIINNIRTIHVRSNFTKQITDANTLYLNENKKKTLKWFHDCGISSVPLAGTKFGVIRSIAFEAEIVNTEETQKSLKVTNKKTLDFLNEQIERGEYDPAKNPNSDYMKAVESGDMKTAQRMVDEAAADAMPESKIRTKSGALLIVYHSTGANFTVFDINRSGQNYDGHSQYGRGMYFAGGKNGAIEWGGYSNVIEAYLDIRKPLYANEATPEELLADLPDLNEWERNWAAKRGENFIGLLNSKGIDSTKYLQQHEYDGVVDEEATINYGGLSAADKHQYVVFDPNQVKSAAPVTYDDSGNVIPLSQRFNTENDDIRYSLKGDLANPDVQDYTGSNKAGDPAKERNQMRDTTGRELSKAQQNYFKDSKLVDQNGDLIVMYHGTANGGFTVFDPEHSDDRTSLFFTSSLANAQSYSGVEGDAYAESGAQNYPVYLNLTDPLIIDADGSNWDEIRYNTPERAKMRKDIDAKWKQLYGMERGSAERDALWEELNRLEEEYEDSDVWSGDMRDTRGIAKWAKQKGYNGVIIHNLTDYGGEMDVEIEPATVAIAFSSEQVKSVTNMNPTGDKDINFSLKNQEDLMRQNAKLKEVNQELQAQFKTTKFAKVDKKALRQFAKQLLKDYQSGADIDETRDALDGVFTYIANGENGESPVWSVAYERAYDTAVSILSNSSVLNDEMFQAYKELRDTLKNTGVTIDKRWDNSLMGYESINEFRKHNYGRIKLVNDGVPVDLMYQELAWKYPEFFDSDSYTNQADQLSHMEEVLNSLQPTEVNPYSHNMREAATWLANDIMERFFELPQAKPTFADKAQQKLTKQVIKDHEKLERVREQKNERIAKLIEERREKVKEVTRKEKEKRDQKVREIKDRYKAKESKMSESRKASVLRARIVRHAQDMSQKLLHPNDKHHVPEELRKSVAAVLDAINLESQFTVDPITGKRQKGVDGDPTKRTQAFNELRKAYQDIIKDDSADIVVDPAIEAMLDQVIGLHDVKLADMNLRQLQTVWDVVRVVEHTINTAGKLLSKSKYEHTVEWANDMVKDTETRRSRKGGKLEAFRIDMENPYTFFSHYGESGKAVFRMLRDAQDKQQMMVENVRDKVRAIVDPKTVRKLEKEVHEITTTGGDELTLTTSQIMDIYLLSKREQAHDHLLRGGIVQPEVKAKKIKRGTDAILLTPEDLFKITSELTDEQREIANKLQEMTRTTLADYGNEASMKAYGYKKFTGDDYWPIKSAREGVHSNVEKGANNTRSIKNIGLAKSVMPHANNPLDIGGVFQTFASHAADMTDYAAWLCPMEDANRLFNFQFRDNAGNRTGKTIKGLLDRVGGKGAQQYWHNLMEDIQNGIKAPKDTAVMGPIRRGYGNAKGASVAWNIRVIVQQPTAILRAAAVLGPDSMVKGVFVGGGWKTALEHSPIAQRKDMGGFDISSPAQMNEILYDSKTGLQRFNEVGMIGASKADALTWGRIWNACESEVRKKNKDLLPKTDEFYEAVNELFTEVIDQSQVVDGVLQRSQLMRSSDALANMATSFMGEPTMAMNMLLRAYDGLVNETDTKKRGAAIKTFGRATIVLLATNVVNALAQSLVDAARDDEDDEYWEKFLTAFTGITGEEETTKKKVANAVLEGNLIGGLNPIGYIPFVKDLLSIMSGYSVQRADAAIMEDLWQAGLAFFESWFGDGKKTKVNALLNLGKQVGKVFGIGVGNLTRDVYAALRTAAIETENIPAQYELEKWIYKNSNDKNASRFMAILYKAYHEDKTAFEKIYAEMVSGDYYRSENEDGEVTTTADYIASKLKKSLMDDLFKLYKEDQTAYKAMYNDLLKRDFLHTGVKNKDPDLDTFVSTEEAIAKAMEERMKKDQGVKKVGDLEQRYLTPSQQPAWNSSMKTIQSSGLWKSATEKQRDELEADLYDLVTGNTSGAKMRETIDAGKSYGVDDAEYLLWQLALDMHDKPSENGDMGNYNNAEKAEAIVAMQALDDSEKAYLWSTTTTSDEVLRALADGVDIDTYALFKAGVSQMEAGVDYKKGDTASRKRAINKLLDEINAGGSTRSWLYHTEYKK